MTRDFLTIMKVSLIPSLAQMIMDEDKHLNYLKSIEGFDVSTFIEESTQTLDHLNLRLTQYMQYVIDNENDVI